MTNGLEPRLVEGRWTEPMGYAFPKCFGCGHNFFERRPEKRVNGKPVDGGLCNWCREEQNEERNSNAR
jgi:hypothetical protein